MAFLFAIRKEDVQPPDQGIPFRLYQLCYLIMVIFLLLISRLFYLQLIAGSQLAVEGLNGRIQEAAIGVSRGDVMDRNGIHLTGRMQETCLLVFPKLLTDPIVAVDKLVNWSGVDRQTITTNIRRGRPFKVQCANSRDSTLVEDLTYQEGIVAIHEKSRYGSDGLASHIIGYLNFADNRGVSGIEAQYDEFLRGGNHENIAAMVDASQQLIPGLGYKHLKLPEDYNRSNVFLTLDSKIQKSVEIIMDQSITKGAVVVIDPYNGEVLALASRPNFQGEQLERYLEDPAAPLLNRALAAYPPGSVFKLAVAAAALEYKVVGANDQFVDPGYIDVAAVRFKGWDYETGGRGKISFSEALAYSSNPVFISVGQKLGSQHLLSYASRLGFSYQGSEALSNGEDLYPGELANFAIGQGKLETTPLQIATLVATIVNDGKKMEPIMVSKLTNEEGKVIKTFNRIEPVRVMSSDTARQLRAMMTGVTGYGTGQAADVEGFGAAGKTGSAETGQVDRQGRGISHAWFAGYTPLREPRYVIVVFVENGMSGSDVAAPIFRQIATKLLAK